MPRGRFVLLLLLVLAGLATRGLAADGDLDFSFGTGGMVTTSLSAMDDVIFSVAIDSNNRIVVAGGVAMMAEPAGPSDNSFGIARYTSSGSLDPSFGTNGTVVAGFDSYRAIGRSVAIDALGRILVAGKVEHPTELGNSNFALLRFTAAGVLDSTFGSGGKVFTDFQGGGDMVSCIALDPGGGIIVAGTTYHDLSGFLKTSFALARYTTAGVLDTTFGTGGKVTTEFYDRSNELQGVAVDASGRIVAAGYTSDSDNNDGRDIAIARYTTAGVLDPAFGTGGKVTTDFSGLQDQANAVVIDVSGNILIAGTSRASLQQNYNFILARYTSLGVLDTSFGTGGKVITDFYGSWDEGAALTLDSGGKVVVSGWAIEGGNWNFALARYDSSGELDTPFGTAGKVTLDFNGFVDRANAVAIQAGGKIVVAGEAWDQGGRSNDFALARFQATSAPGISLQVGAATIASGGAHHFGASDLGLEASVTVTITNSGNTPLTGISTTVTPTGNTDFRTGSLPPATLAVGASAEFSLIFDPQGTGNRTGTLQISSNAVPNPYLIQLSGTGTDNIPPEITNGAADFSVFCDAPDKLELVNAWLAAHGTATATDNSGSVVWSHNFTAMPGVCGAVTVTFTATDGSGNSSTTAAQLISVDNTAPAITTSAADLVVESNGQGNVPQRNAWLGNQGGAMAMDNCGTVGWSHNFAALANTLPQTVPVTFTAADNCGNSATTSAIFIIQDTTPPQITVPATDYYGDQSEGAADLADFLDSRGGAAAVDIAGPVTWTNNYVGPPPPVGGYVSVTFTATDTVGLSASTTCRFFLFPPGAVWIGPATGPWNYAPYWRIPNGVLPDAGRDCYVDLFDFQNTRTTMNGNFGVKNLYIGAGDQVDMDGTLTVHGNLISNAGLLRSRIEGDTTGSARYLYINGQTTLQGPGRFLFSGAARNQILAGTVAPQELTVGAGQEITTTADTYGGYQGTSIHARLVNHGTLSADGGGLNLYSQPKTNHGVFRAINGGNLEILPPVDNTGGTVLAGDASTVVLQNTLTGGTVTGPGTLLINAPAGLAGPMLLDSNLTAKFQRWATTLTGTITNNGVMHLGLHDDASTPYFHINGPVTLDGSGKIIFQGVGRRQILRANSAAADVLTIGASQEITTDANTGASYQSSSIHAGLVNFGTITADAGGLTLYSQPKTNHHVMRAINGGFLDIESDVDNTNATLFAGAGSTLHLESTLTGGTVTGPGKLLINTSAALTGPILLDNGLTTVLDGSTTTLTGTITNNGVMTFGSDTSTGTAYVDINGPVSLEGSGKIIIQNSGRRQLLRANGAATDVLTLGPQQEITTDSRTGLNYQSSALHAPIVNHGTITANGGGLTIYSGAKTNHGTMRALNGGRMAFVSVTVTNYNATTDTLTGGRWEVESDGPVTWMDFGSSPVVNLAPDTTVRLSGANASLAQLSSLRNISGTLVLENGKTLATSGNMVIPGVLQYGLPAAPETTRLAVTGNVDFTGTRIDIADLGLATGSYLLATWTGTLTGAPVLGSLPSGSQHQLELDPVAKTLRLEVNVTPPVQEVSFAVTPGTGADEGKNHIALSGQGAPDAEYRVEASADLTEWTPVSPVLSSPTGALSWNFLQDAGFPRRFYRFKPE